MRRAKRDTDIVMTVTALLLRICLWDYWILQ